MMRINKEQGSITIVVFATVLFILLILATTLTTMTYKRKSQAVELEDLKEIYSMEGEEKIQSVYQEVAQSKGLLDGTGTEADPYKIYTIEDLVRFSNRTNAGDTFEGKFVELMTSLDFNEDYSYEKPNRTDYGDINENGIVETLKTELTTGKGFKPIGITKAKSFKGTFEGNNNILTHLYIDNDNSQNGNGLFGNSYTIIKNLTIKDSSIEGLSVTGAIAGNLRGGSIINCHNNNTTITLKEGDNTAVGGIVGQTHSSTETSGCTNTGTINGLGMLSGYGSRAGGIVGNALSCTLTNCSNEGEVTGSGTSVGGVAGYANTVTATNCSNKGEIMGSVNYIGGIIGTSDSGATLTNCSNEGKVTGTGTHTGGILGGGYPGLRVTNCSNTGYIKGGTSYTGGIIGGANSLEKVLNDTIEICYNSGTVEGSQYVGGILGRLAGAPNQGATMIKCYNKGIIIGTTNVGEILGQQGTKTGINILNKLFYLQNVNANLTALGGENDDQSKQIESVPDNLTYNQFKTWILSQ